MLIIRLRIFFALCITFREHFFNINFFQESFIIFRCVPRPSPRKSPTRSTRAISKLTPPSPPCLLLRTDRLFRLACTSHFQRSHPTSLLTLREAHSPSDALSHLQS